MPEQEEPLMMVWRGRIVLCGFAGDPKQFFMAEAGQTDWSFLLPAVLPVEPDEPHIVQE